MTRKEKWTWFWSRWFATTGASFTLITLLFSVMSLLWDEIGPTNWTALLLLFVMCAVIAAWTSFVPMFVRNGSWLHLLLAYGGCVGAVFGIGAATGFIPVVEGTAALNWTVFGMASAVYVGTAVILAVREISTERRINARLQMLRQQDSLQKGGDEP